MDSFARLGLPLKSLLDQVAALGSFSISSFPFLPNECSRSKWWFSFSRSAFPCISHGDVNVREFFLFSQRFSVFYALAHPSPALDVPPNSLRLLSLAFILPPFATPLTGAGCKRPLPPCWGGDVVAF